MSEKKTKTSQSRKLQLEQNSAHWQQLESWMEGQLKLLELAFADFVTARSRQNSCPRSR
ncbi:MAG: hypothetical protein MK108_13855 [Mariniblastus sp.]|nr:hypothetical protein [Mariniblastus sp.]